MKVFLTTFLALTFYATLSAGAQDSTITASHYRIYGKNGEVMRIEELVQQMRAADVVFLGEEHNDPVAHYLQFELLKALFEADKARPIVLAMEQFERDTQEVLDLYLAGKIRERDLKLDSRPWTNYDTDYKPMIEFAKTNRIPVIAGNAPRRFVSLTGREGIVALNSLPKIAKQWFPPLPLHPASAAYGQKFNAEMERQMGAAHNNPKMLEAQNLRDATMGWSVAQALKQYKKALVVHINGVFHSESALGTPEQVMHYHKKARIFTVTMHAGMGFPEYKPSEHQHLGDVLILTDPSLPRTDKRN
ncbi:MAG TPA: ChaN family lipoprotein [Rhodothermales bacterium]|nr:ChaN family lipoprotein [Rhodothermales bacterium]HRR09038.1 ChaN family lipoprotein [Rhodothermales bacterium]